VDDQKTSHSNRHTARIFMMNRRFKSEVYPPSPSERFYFKRCWAELRGDVYSNWGQSWWYFETDAAGQILRQIEEYDNGITQFYDLAQPENAFGSLGERPLSLDEFQEYAIFQEDFELLWMAVKKPAKGVVARALDL
jgi:hypothetical protein